MTVYDADLEKLRAKVSRIESALTEAYGKRIWSASNYSDDLLGALIATILSQNTSDLNSGRAFQSLLRAYPGGWQDVLDAPVGEVADSIRAGGLADIKAARIQTVLAEIVERSGALDLEPIRNWTDAEIVSYLRALSGVGAKTAACILMFNLGRPALAVDTHVHRVAGRLGLIGPKVNADKAHDELAAIVEPYSRYSVHVHFIEHGRRTCHARNPECKECPVISECIYVRTAV